MNGDEKWKDIISHNEKEIKGFFSGYRFLSNLWNCKVVLEGEDYVSVENAYQAIKYKSNERDYFKTCTPKESSKYVKVNQMTNYTTDEWNQVKLDVMKRLLIQKYDKDKNPELYQKLKDTGEKYLEETNYWGDKFWGVAKSTKDDVGEGENNLGKMLMGIRSNL